MIRVRGGPPNPAHESVLKVVMVQKSCQGVSMSQRRRLWGSGYKVEEDRESRKGIFHTVLRKLLQQVSGGRWGVVGDEMGEEGEG